MTLGAHWLPPVAKAECLHLKPTHLAVVPGLIGFDLGDRVDVGLESFIPAIFVGELEDVLVAVVLFDTKNIELEALGVVVVWVEVSPEVGWLEKLQTSQDRGVFAQFLGDGLGSHGGNISVLWRWLLVFCEH